MSNRTYPASSQCNPIPCDPCPKIRLDCGKPMCFVCVSCKFPTIYQKVVCCASRAYADRLAKCNDCSGNGCDNSMYASSLYSRIAAVRDLFLAYLERACCCICETRNWEKDCGGKEKYLNAMVDIICCYFCMVGAGCDNVLPIEISCEQEIVNLADGILSDYETQLTLILRCICGTPCVQAPVVCNPCNNLRY